MGVEAVVGGLFGLASAGISAASAAHAQSAQASAQANLNKKTMDFNKKEAEKARNFSAEQANIDRIYNSREALAARSFTAAQARQMMDYNSNEANLAREFNAGEALKARTFDAQQSYLARQFEERMSSTAHQREVQDLRNAGLNPILSATGGNGASTPVAPIVASPMATSPAASIGLGSSAQSSHSGSGTVAASVGAMQALKKGNLFGSFMSSALDLVKANADLKKAEASDKEAEASLKNAQTNALRQTQDALESMERITNIKSETDLNKWKSLSEKEQVNLWKEKIISEIRERTDKHNLSEAQQQAVMISANAAATSASAQAHLADIQDRIQSAESPVRIYKLQKEANYWQSEFDKNKWIMDDPENILKREWWKNNEGAVGVKEAAHIIGEVFHSGMFLPIK